MLKPGIRFRLFLAALLVALPGATVTQAAESDTVTQSAEGTASVATANATAETTEATPDKSGQAEEERKQADKEAIKESAQTPLDLALKGISLSQGENGFEIWRLKAEWANLEKQDDTVITKQPRLTYFMKDGKNSLSVEADSGEVNQKTQILRFVHSVRAMQDDKQLSGELLVYNGEDKTMRMPEGGKFTASGMAGSCSSITWHIEENRIEATGGVSIFMAMPDKTDDKKKLSLERLTEERLKKE